MDYNNGNLNELILTIPEKKGWFLGSFMSEKSKYFFSQNMELKWGIHKKGEKREGSYTETSRKTVSILVNGKAKIIFPEINEEIILSNQGDYLIFDTMEGLHNFEALEDCVVLTVRTPSIPYNRKI